MAAVVGASLGLVAIGVDGLPASSNAARLILVVFSTGLSWGASSFLVGARCQGVEVAAICGAGTLTTAAAGYYGGIVVFATRSSVTSSSLVSAATVWIGLAAAVGPVLGALGWFARRGDRWQRSVAWGTVGGILASQGISTAMRFPEDLVAGGWPQVFLMATIGIPVLGVFLATYRLSPLVAIGALVLVGLASGAVFTSVMELV